MPATIDGRREQARVARDGTTHAGLWLDKHLRALRLPDGTPARDEPDAGQAIRELLEEAAGTPVPAGYDAALRRRRALLEGLDGGFAGGTTLLFTAEAQGRLVIGLGTQSVRETSLSLLHTWGVPYLPGSALKGLASTAAHRLGGDAWKKGGEDHTLLFGDTARAGSVVFHDAWWMPDLVDTTLPLDLDVMTVHHPDYYRDGGSPPADWDEPNPVAFLTARGRYLAALSGPEAWVPTAGKWLALGLDRLGIGAKTQAGYGRMALSPERTAAELTRDALRAQHASRLADLANLPAQHKGAGTARQHVEKLREAVTAGAPAEEVYAVARRLYERDPKFWRGWAKDAKRTTEERAFVAESGMLDAAPAGRPR